MVWNEAQHETAARRKWVKKAFAWRLSKHVSFKKGHTSTVYEKHQAKSNMPGGQLTRILPPISTRLYLLTDVNQSLVTVIFNSRTYGESVELSRFGFRILSNNSIKRLLLNKKV